MKAYRRGKVKNSVSLAYRYNPVSKSSRKTGQEVNPFKCLMRSVLESIPLSPC